MMDYFLFYYFHSSLFHLFSLKIKLLEECGSFIRNGEVPFSPYWLVSFVSNYGKDLWIGVYNLFLLRNYDLGKEKFVDGVKHMEEIINNEQYDELHVLDMYCKIILRF